VTASSAALFALSALGVINPRFTPADLVRTSGQVLLLTLSAPKDKALAAEVVETLKGKPLPQKSLTLELADDAEVAEDDLASPFGEGKTAAGILLLPPAGDAAEGAIQIDTQWFAVVRQKDKWCLDRDKRDLFSVWAGSAPLLAEAARYVLADPAASFPVRSDITWGSDLALGKLPGRVNGCLVADFGKPVGLCVLVLADTGDRLYRAGAKGAPPADVTQTHRLQTASRAAALGDFDGDGRLDLASWNGGGLHLATQAADGSFALRGPAVEVPECLSLHAVDGGLAAGTAKGPVLLAFTGKMPAPPPQEAAPDLGPGGFCVPADFDLDGRCDLLQLFSKGTVLYAGEGAGKFKPPLKTPVALPRKPCAAVCGDYDADGRLDLVVAGEDGLALLRQGSGGRWDNATRVTGELAYHGNANQPAIVAAAPCDINSDGRQGVALFYPKRVPMVFFNRGFACFGLARELELSGIGSASDALPDPFAPPPPPRLKAAEALQTGQAAGTILDLNCDGAEDMLAVTPQGDVWVLFGKAEDRPSLGLTLALPPAARGPVTVAVSNERRRIAMHVVRPGGPAHVGLQEPGPLVVEWPDANGQKHRRQVVVESPTRLELAP